MLISLSFDMACKFKQRLFSLGFLTAVLFQLENSYPITAHFLKQYFFERKIKKQNKKLLKAKFEKWAVM